MKNDYPIRTTGFYQNVGGLNYFIPHPLPPKDPILQIDAEMLRLYGEASFALGQLNEMCLRLPDIKRFIRAYVIKEALLSSAIEGIHTTIIEVFTTTIGESKLSKETQLVINYIYALDTAISMLEEEGFPLATRVILKAHEALMGKGGPSDPGSFRKQAVCVGTLTPPPPTELNALMGSLEKYIKEPSEIPSLIKAGLMHVQFETIHPFLDGNGRIGRLLIVLMLIDSGLMRLPVLYPSYYFKKYHVEYYRHLDRVRTHGDFEGWIKYYLAAIRDSALDAHKRAKDIENLEYQINLLIEKDTAFVKMRETALSIVKELFSKPIGSISEISQGVGKSYNAVHNILKIFMEKGLVVASSLHQRNKLFSFKPYIELLEKEYTH